MPWTYTFHRQAMLNRTTRILKPIASRTRFHGETIKMLWLKRSCYDLKRSQRFHAKTRPLQWLKTKCYDLTLPLVKSIDLCCSPRLAMYAYVHVHALYSAPHFQTQFLYSGRPPCSPVSAASQMVALHMTALPCKNGFDAWNKIEMWSQGWSVGWIEICVMLHHGLHISTIIINYLYINIGWPNTAPRVY